MHPARHREEGFTLIEILIVVSIIGLLMAFVANTFFGRAEEAKITLTEAQIQKLSQTLDLYKLDNGRYPTTDQGLQALVREPTSAPAPRRYQQGGYVKDRDLKDAWSGDFVYEAPGRTNSFGFDLCSPGPDGVAGSGGQSSDDICNYSAEDRR